MFTTMLPVPMSLPPVPWSAPVPMGSPASPVLLGFWSSMVYWIVTLASGAESVLR